MPALPPAVLRHRACARRAKPACALTCIDDGCPLLSVLSPGADRLQARVTALADSAGPAELAALVAEASGLGGCTAGEAAGCV